MKTLCFQMSRKALLAAVMVVCMAFPALAQNITVSGTVVDGSGEPMIGASVIVQGESLGTATDIDGNYTLKAPANGTLTFSYIGYETQSVPVNGQSTINVVLKENTVMLDAVVAIGYGTVKKSDATGSVAVIKPDDIEAGLAVSTQDLLVGASSGVVVTTNGGNPTGSGTIRIRGGSSLSANNNPLIVIDGVPMTDQGNAGGTNALTMINPQDIENMTILKDASATAIYGSRASNGVIIVTTKKGSSGKPKVNFAANFHVNTARKTLDVMSGPELAATVRDVLASENGIAMLGNANTDWQKEILRTSFSQDYNLSVSGTIKSILPYRFSASYTDNDGILKTSGMQRTTVGFNLSPKFFNGLISVNANAQGTFIKSREADMDAVGNAIRFNPTLAPKTAYPTAGNTGRTMFNGYTAVTTSDGSLELQAPKNPLALLEDKNNTGKAYSSTGNLQIDAALPFLRELHFNLNLGYQVSKNTSRTYQEENSVMSWYDNGLASMGAAGAGTRYEWYRLQRNTLLDFYINYRKDFEAIRSALDVMAGYSWQKFDYSEHSNTYVNTLGYKTNNGLPIFENGTYQLNTDPSSEALLNTAVNNAPMYRKKNPLQLVSFFGRLNYTFDDSYLLTFTLRDDGTSRFHKDNRWGLFPSLALAWKVANMPVFEDIRPVWNDFKLRFGWGMTGQQDLGDDMFFPYMATYTQSYQQGFGYINPAGEWIYPLYPNAYDANMKWETTETWNAGMDFGFLNNRITATVDWYLRNTRDLLAFAPNAGVNTANYMWRNIGSLRNTGVEATITAKPVVTPDFTWSTSYNIGFNKNKITKLTGDAETSQIKARNTPSGTGTGLQYHMVGEPAFTYLVFQQVYDPDGNPIPGQYVDQNADGKIDDNDKIKFHSPEPKVTMTWNNTFNYKNWDLGISLRANFGNWVYNNPRFEFGRLGAIVGYGLGNCVTDTYLFPDGVENDKLILSDYFVENAGFIRCDNITLGYTMDNLLNNNLKLRFFGAVQNPFVITKYKGIDPEVFDGIDNDLYPRPITFTLGLVATF